MTGARIHAAAVLWLLALGAAPARADVAITTGSLPDGRVGIEYSASLAAAGGERPYRWSIVLGDLPAGLSLSDSGLIRGIPQHGGTFAFTVRVRDGDGESATRRLDITVAPASPLTIASGALPAGMVGLRYTQALSATGGEGSYRWSIASGSLPPGLLLDGGRGVIDGIPVAAGSFAFTVRVADAIGGSDTEALSIQVVPPLAVAAGTMPQGIVGAAYSATLAATGGFPPYGWAVAAGSLPPGLSLSGSTIAGTPGAAGTFAFTVRVTDGQGGTATRQVSITVTAPPLEITTGSLAAGVVGTPYSQALAATGGVPPYGWAVAAGSLPPGLSLSGSTIAGTPGAAGTFAFTVRVTDGQGGTATRQVSITVTAPPLEITTGSLVAGVVGTPYSQALAATGGVPPYGWAVAAGSLPPGLSLSGSTIAGTPGAAGTFAFTVRVTDGQGGTATRQVSITVTAPPLEITTGSLAAGEVGTPYAQALAATGGFPPYGWAVAAGSLPPGLSLSGSTIAGTPGAAGTFAFTVRVTDGQGGTATRQVSITVTAPPLEITTGSLAAGVVGTPYSQALEASGGARPYTWRIDGQLPPGLALSGSVISGTPETTGTFSFTVRVSDGESNAARRLSIVIGGPNLEIATASLPAGVVGAPYSQRLAATGGLSPYTWSATGSLPPGLALSGAVIAGTPSAAGTFAFTVRVSDSRGSAERALSITIGAAPLAIETASLTAGVAGAAYTQALAASGGTPPYAWSVDGPLPPGLALSGSVISGAPETAGTFALIVRVSDAENRSASRELALEVKPRGLHITSAPPPRAAFGQPYRHALTAAGGTPPYTWSATGSLPPGLAVDASGAIAGTPSAVGTFTFTVRVADAPGASAARDEMLVVAAAVLPEVRITGGAEALGPMQQPVVGIELAAPYPLPLSGQLTLSFEPDAAAPADDPAVQFATGGRAVSFTIPGNATAASFAIPSMAFQTGTVAGAITLRLTLGSAEGDVTPPGGAARVMRIPRGAPAIRSASLALTSTGFEVRLVGLATGRELESAGVRLTGAPGSTLQTADLTVPLAEAAAQWYGDPAAAAFGSQFSLVLPFTVQGDTRSIASVTVTLKNATGTSEPAVLTFP